ncbi:rhomboid family intramembrane serine protease [Streptomyces sp. NPDC090022]|uniref:rhomboid family intramembrane serine protease n=1 Tax=Streptomyces sp. NPDC090022 TaxID=3365920 RepID=UPI0037F4C674
MDTDRQPGCYRHPDREGPLRCTRCERPICTDCMIDAAVGFQCPQCVRGASVPTRNIAGGVMTAGDPHLVTKVLIGINVAVFFAGLLVPAILVPMELLGRYVEYIGAPLEGVSTGQYYRLLTSVFLHGEWWHIASNMLGLWVLGGPLEAALGRARYLTLYLLSGFAGSAVVYWLTPPNLATLGASGAVIGLLGATAVQFRRMRYDMRPVIVMVVLMLVTTFAFQGVSWQAHLGGLIAGAVIGAGMMLPASTRHRSLIQWGTCVLVFLAAAALIVLRTAALT